MGLKLERALALGDGWVAALVHQTVQWRAGEDPRVLWADKGPVAILLVCAGRVQAFTPAGEPLAIEAVERLCPGATEQFLRRRPPRTASAVPGWQTK